MDEDIKKAITFHQNGELNKAENLYLNILKKYTDTYLALCINSDTVKNNIKIYCQENEFDSERIIFLNPIKHVENLKRMSTFDLYLDTYPYNGHTGISDSLFQSCVPTISFTGYSFASRVSYSLLNTLNLQQLITFNEKEYSNKINYFCSHRDELKTIKDYLISYKSKNLNRMKGFTKDFEDLMLSLIDSNQQIKPRNNKI
jgi:predicted O-linked N-acetylglucosamine transferase (SPINDLY family)